MQNNYFIIIVQSRNFSRYDFILNSAQCVLYVANAQCSTELIHLK